MVFADGGAAPSGGGLLRGGVAVCSKTSGRSYELLELLGQGSMTQVWLVKDEGGRRYAAKLGLLGEEPARPSRSPTCPPLAKRTGDERRQAAQPVRNALADEVPRLQAASEALGARKTATLLEGFCSLCVLGGRRRNVSAVVMQLVDGCCARRLLDLGPAPEALCSTVLREACQALQTLHFYCLAHGNFSSSNILLGLDGSVRLCDFGCLVQVQCREDVLEEAASGAPSEVEYRAPEVDGKLETTGFYWYSRASDVWSVGATTLELSLGVASTGDLAKIDELHSHSARAFVRQCLQTAPWQRATIEELVASEFLRPGPRGAEVVSRSVSQVVEASSRSCSRSSGPSSRSSAPSSRGSVGSLPQERPATSSRTPAQGCTRDPGRVLGDELVRFTPRFGVESCASGTASGYAYAARAQLGKLGRLPLGKLEGELAELPRGRRGAASRMRRRQSAFDGYPTSLTSSSDTESKLRGDVAELVESWEEPLAALAPTVVPSSPLAACWKDSTCSPRPFPKQTKPHATTVVPICSTPLSSGLAGARRPRARELALETL